MCYRLEAHDPISRPKMPVTSFPSHYERPIKPRRSVADGPRVSLISEKRQQRPAGSGDSPAAAGQKTSKRVHFVKKLIKEVAGFAPYGRRIVELLRVQKDKLALKVAKKKLGTHKREKKKREQMSEVIRKTKTGGADRKK